MNGRAKKATNFILILISFFLLPGFKKDQQRMKYFPSEFNSVPFGSIEKSPCSPNGDDRKTKKLEIRVPSEIRVTPKENTSLPICGFYYLDTLSVLNAEQQIHIQDVKKLKPLLSFTLHQVREDNEAPDPSLKKPIDESRFKNQISSMYFHFDTNFWKNYWQITLQPGEYTIYLTYGKIKSNTVKFKIKEL